MVIRWGGDWRQETLRFIAVPRLLEFWRILCESCPSSMHGKDAEAERDFARCLELDPDLKASLTSRIDEAKRQRSAIH
jgi:hypothetical protein